MIDIIGPKSIKEIKQEIEEKYHVELRSIGDDRYTLYKVGNEKNSERSGSQHFH